MNVVSQTNLPNPPNSFITALEFTYNGKLLVGSISGELVVYDTIFSKEPRNWQFKYPILSIVCFENLIYVLHPNCISFTDNIDLINSNSFNELNLHLNLMDENDDNFQKFKINEDLNILIIATLKGYLMMYNLPDLIKIDLIKIDSKIQTFDLYLNYLIIATSKGENQIFDLSSKNFINLTIQESGFKYPITTDLKIIDNIKNLIDFPHFITYAQSGIEGKVSIITTKIDSQTEPTVTINTAAKSAPISNSSTNPSGLIISEDPNKFIFKAHRTTLNDNNILVAPIYSLNTIDKYLITTGYGGNNNNNNNNSIEGSLCLWDINLKKRIKICRGFPLSVVKTAIWKNKFIVCGCSCDKFKNMPLPDNNNDNGRNYRQIMKSSLILIEIN